MPPPAEAAFSGLALAAAAGGAQRRVQSAFGAFLAARQAFVTEALSLLARRDDDGRVTLEALMQADLVAALCCPLIQDASQGVRASALQALARLAAAAPPVAEALPPSGVLEAVVMGLAADVSPAVQIAANSAVQALARSGGRPAAAAALAAGAREHLMLQLETGSPAVQEAAVRTVEALILADPSLVPVLVGGDALKHFGLLLLGAEGSNTKGSSSTVRSAALSEPPGPPRLLCAVLGCLSTLCALGPESAEAAERSGILRAAATAAAQHGAHPTLRAQALALLAHSARQSPALAAAAADAGGAAPALAALTEPGDPRLRLAGAALLLELCRRGPELAAAAIGDAGPVLVQALARYLELESEEQQGSGGGAVSTSSAKAADQGYLDFVGGGGGRDATGGFESAVLSADGICYPSQSGKLEAAAPVEPPTVSASGNSTSPPALPAGLAKTGALLAGSLARISPELAAALMAAHVPQHLMARLEGVGSGGGKGMRGGARPAAGAAAWALQQMADHGEVFATALVDLGALQALTAAYAGMQRDASLQESLGSSVRAGTAEKGGGVEAAAAAQVKGAAKALIRGCSSAAALEPLVDGAGGTPPPLLRHVLERLAVLLAPRDARGAAARRAFVSAGGLGRLVGVSGAAAALAAGNTKLEARLRAGVGYIAMLFPPEVVQYYAAAVVVADQRELQAVE